MTLYYCGWNGCGQVCGQPSIISKPSTLAIGGSILSVSCSWSILCIATDESLAVSGFIGNRSRICQQICLGDGSKAINVSSCLHRTLIASSNGRCYEYKADTDSLRQLINFSKTEPHSKETALSEEDSIVRVSCSDYCNLALSKSGRVFQIPTPLSSPDLVVTEVSCGNEHCVLLTNTGSVYTWGSSSRGQLGHGSLEPEESPRLVDALAGVPVRSVSTGAWHNAVVTSSGDLYTWGWGSDGQLGVEEEEEEQEAEAKQDDEIPKSVKRLKTDQQASTAQERTDKYRGIVQADPVPVDTPSDVDSVSCGTRHTVILLVDGSIWGCGWNAYGQLGCSPDSCKRSTKLRQIIIPDFNGRISKVQCGGWSTCLIV